MPRRSTLRATFCLLVVVACCAGCTVGGGGRTSRGKVSDVARAAGEDPDRPERARTDRTPPPDRRWEEEEEDRGLPVTALVGASLAGDGGGSSSGSGSTPPARRRNLLLWGSRTLPAGDVVDPVNSVTVAYSFFLGGQVRPHVGAYYGRAAPGPQPLAAAGLDELAEFGLDIGARRYLTPEHTLMGVYGLLGLRFAVLRWEYAQPVTVTAGGGAETISHDALWLVTPYLGLGTSLLQTGPLHVGLNGSWGLRLHSARTLEDFENDLFKDSGEVKVNVEAALFF